MEGVNSSNFYILQHRNMIKLKFLKIKKKWFEF